jgi:glycosyltransferase involved in cell wall biosynthesis
MGKNNKKQQAQAATGKAAIKAALAPAKQPPVAPPKDDDEKATTSYEGINKNKYTNATPGNYNFAGPKCKDRVALVMMIKNEEKRIEVSYDSVRSITNTFVILDTGSTDRTIEITRAYCKKHGITLHLKEEPFVNFEVSRNVLLDWADEALKNHYFLLQLDSNDELRNHSEIVKFVENHSGTQTGFHLRQQWWTGNSLDTYFNIRMVISHFGWRYKGVVHEYICRRTPGGDSQDILKINDIILFQDRTKDDDKSMRRFKRDKELLYNEHLKHPEEPRTLFYLAQTCSCLQQYQEAYEYNLLRTKQGGFVEEVYHSYYRCGQLAQILNHPWEESLGWYLKAYGHSRRAEPLVAIAEYYMTNNYLGEGKADWHLAYTFINEACQLAYPHNQILFIDKNSYIYKRHNLMGIIAFYVNKFKEGKQGAVRALQSQDNDLDMKNLLFYLQKEQEVAMQQNLQNLDQYMIVTTDRGELFSQAEYGLGIGTAQTEQDIIAKAKKRLGMR